MVTPLQFCTDLFKDIQAAEPMDRQAIVKGYAKTLESMLGEARSGQGWYDRFYKELEKTPVPIRSGNWDKDAADWVEKCAKKAARI